MHVMKLQVLHKLNTPTCVSGISPSSDRRHYRGVYKGKGKGRFMGLFNTAAVRPIIFLPPTSSRIHLQRRHASYRCARPLPAKAGTITNEFGSKSVIHENSLGSFTCRKAGTWDIFYFPSEGRHSEEFFRLPKNPTASAGFEPANSGSSGQYANH